MNSGALHPRRTLQPSAANGSAPAEPLLKQSRWLELRVDRFLALPRWKMLSLACAADLLPSVSVALLLFGLIHLAGWPMPASRHEVLGWRDWVSSGLVTPLIESIVVCGLARFFRAGEDAEWKGAAWAAGLFALMHLFNSWLNMLAAFPSFFLEMLLFLRLQGQGLGFWRALWLPVFIHAVHNTAVFLMSYLEQLLTAAA